MFTVKFTKRNGIEEVLDEVTGFRFYPRPKSAATFVAYLANGYRWHRSSGGVVRVHNHHGPVAEYLTGAPPGAETART